MATFDKIEWNFTSVGEEFTRSGWCCLAEEVLEGDPEGYFTANFSAFCSILESVGRDPRSVKKKLSNNIQLWPWRRTKRNS